MFGVSTLFKTIKILHVFNDLSVRFTFGFQFGLIICQILLNFILLFQKNLNLLL